MRSFLIFTTIVLSSMSFQQSHAQDFLYRLPGDQVSSFYGIELGNGLSLGYGLGYSASSSAGTPVVSDNGGTIPETSDGVVVPAPKVSQAHFAKQVQKKQQLAAKIAKRRAELQRMKRSGEHNGETAPIAKQN